MAHLLSDLDASIFDEAPSQSSPPKPSSSPQRRRKISDGANPSSSLPLSSRSPLKKRARKAASPIKSETLPRSSPPHEARSANDELLQDALAWMEDDLVPSPVTKKPSLLQDITNVASTSAVRIESPCKPAAAKPNFRSKLDSHSSLAATDPLPKESVRAYTRCRVEEVRRQRYTPEKYLDAPADLHATKGVRPETVLKAMQRDEVVLDLKIMKRSEGGASLEQEKERRRAYLRDEWLGTSVQKGDIVHLIGDWRVIKVVDHVEISLEDGDSEEELWNQVDSVKRKRDLSTMVLSSSSTPGSSTGNLLILHPDILLSATAISAVPTCVRKPLLQSRLKSSGAGDGDGPSEEMVMGNMLHEVLQSCLTGKEKELPELLKSTSSPDQMLDLDCPFPEDWSGPTPTNFSAPFVKRQVWKQVCCSLDDILSVGLDTRTAQNKLWDNTKPFGQFANLYLGSGPINVSPNVAHSSVNASWVADVKAAPSRGIGLALEPSAPCQSQASP